MRSVWSLLAPFATLLVGCSVAPVSTNAPISRSDPGPANTTPLKGLVHGGQQPIQGASVYMFALSDERLRPANPSVNVAAAQHRS
jgi:hypothetical protein